MQQNINSALIGSIQKFSVEDGPGIRTTIFFKGCPLSCKWCHNPELIKPGQQLIQTTNNCIGCGYCIQICPKQAIWMKPDEGITIDRKTCDVCLLCADNCFAKALRPVAAMMSINEIMEAVIQDKGFYDNTGGGITLSGGEILMQTDFVEKLIDEAAVQNINVCLDTSGFGDAQSLKKLAAKENVTDILYDMKAIDDQVHVRYTGVSNKRILENLQMLAEQPRLLEKITMRMPLIKDINDNMEMIQKTGEFYQQLGIRKINLLPYHNLGISKQRNIGGKQDEFVAPDEERITEIKCYLEKIVNTKVEILGRV